MGLLSYVMKAVPFTL